MNNAPKRIWAFYTPDDFDDAATVTAYETPQHYGQEYVRADVAAAMVSKAREEGRREEREACAAIAVSRMDYPQLGPMSGPDCMCAKIAADIRVRGADQV